MQASERIREALKDKTRGFRGPNREREHVELFAGDIVECCNALGDKADPVALQLKKGSTSLGLGEDSKVTIQADDAFHLMEQLGSIEVKHSPPIT